MADAPFTSTTDFLTRVGQMDDREIPMAVAAIVLASLDMPGIFVGRYFLYLEDLVTRVRQRHADLLSAGADNDVHTQIAALKHILADEDGFTGDTERYDDLDNANLIRVIDRRKGMPISLSILYLHAGLGAGFDMEGLNFPGHFLVRIKFESQMVIIDPFERCAVLGAPEMRALIKQVQGAGAELSAAYYQPVSARDMLIRLQNNIKLRQVEMEDYASALRTVERMRLLDPREFRLLLDAGVLYAKVGQPKAAINMLNDYIDQLPVGDRNRHDAILLLTELQRQLT